MNTPSPLVPQGTTPARGKSTFFFKVLMILTVHVVLIGGMLLQGCKDTKDSSSNPPPDTTASTTDTLPPVNNTTVSNAATTPPQTAQTVPAAPAQPPVQGATPPTATTTPAPPPAPLTQPTQATVPPPTAPPSTEIVSKDYVISTGDTLGAVAHKNGISLKALMEANPGVNPKKLQIGQKIQIPGGTGAAASTTGASSPGADMAASGDATVYSVKSGDTLSKIAKANHTTVKKIMALNDLKTTSIKVAQKLKIPPPKAAGTETPAPAAPAVVSQPAPPAVPTTQAAPSTTASNQ